MAIVLDILLLSLMAVVIVFDAKKGFLLATVSFSRLLIAFICAFLFSGFLATFLNDIWIHAAVADTIADSFEKSDVISEGQLVLHIPLFFRAVATISGIDLKGAADIGNHDINTYANMIATPISQVISTFISFLFLFIFTYLFLKFFVPCLSKIIRKIPVIHTIDILGGFLFGIFHAFLIGWILAVGIGFIIALDGNFLRETWLIRYLSKAMPIRLIIKMFFN